MAFPGKTGNNLSLGTSWGLLRHYWVLAKFLLTAFATVVLLAKMGLITYAARLAGESILPVADLRAAGSELMIHSAGGLLVLLVALVLSVYKPRGLTVYGRRKQQGPWESPAEGGQPSLVSIGSNRVLSKSGSVGVSLRYSHLVGIAVVIVILHFVALHFVDMPRR